MAPGQKWLVAGIDKTGTSCVKHAVQILSQRNCLHFTDLIVGNFELTQQWIDLLENLKQDERVIEKRLKTLTQNYAAMSGIPATAFLKELLTIYPNLKVILTTRDSEIWVCHFKNKLVSLQQPFVLKKILQCISYFVPIDRPYKLYHLAMQHVLGKDYCTQNCCQLIESHIAWHNKVCSIVPSNQLLIYNIQQEWNPLCNFLNCEQPDVAFPAPKTLSVARVLSIVEHYLPLAIQLFVCFVLYYFLGFCLFKGFKKIVNMP